MSPQLDSLANQFNNDCLQFQIHSYALRAHPSTLEGNVHEPVESEGAEVHEVREEAPELWGKSPFPRVKRRDAQTKPVPEK